MARRATKRTRKLFRKQSVKSKRINKRNKLNKRSKTVRRRRNGKRRSIRGGGPLAWVREQL
jgi:hypothetical protein